jgi:hypothetical protein
MLASTSVRIAKPLRWVGRISPTRARRLLKLRWRSSTLQLVSRLRAERRQQLEAEIDPGNRPRLVRDLQSAGRVPDKVLFTY